MTTTPHYIFLSSLGLRGHTAEQMCAMDTTAMANLRGRVCQLNYNGSGILEILSTVGLPKHVPFLKSPVPLGVGQRVRFRLLSSHDDVQAVDIGLEPHAQLLGREVPQFLEDTNDLKTTSTGESPKKSQLLASEDVMSLVPAQSHSRCFLRRMRQFQNSDPREQAQLVIEAERSLQKLLCQSTLDGDAICRLARKCASWLHPPVLQTSQQKQSDQKSVRGTEDHIENLQGRVRKILINALNHLDLQDPSTFKAMKAALFYMASLCERLEKKYGFSSVLAQATPARTQWLELKTLLEDSRLESLSETILKVEESRPPSPLAQDQQMKRVIQRKKRKRRGQVVEYYEPTARIKALSTVSQGVPVKLKCSECPFTLTSSWYLQHPKTLKCSVIAPRDGHETCQQDLKKRCSWKNLDGSPVVRAFGSDLEYCPHQRLLVFCKSCGGGRVCVHGKRRDRCQECKHLYAGRRVKRS